MLWGGDMKEISDKYNKVKVVYYSGTGGTARVAETFASTFREEGCEVSIQALVSGTTACNEAHDLLVIIFAVHGCNAPAAIYSWIESTEEVQEIPAAVVSVSGGGAVSPNTACRLSSIKKLEAKGYKTIYEEMFIMPSNWIVPTKEPLSLMLLEILPKKVMKVVDNILSGEQRRTKPLLIDRFFSLVGELEKAGARAFGKRIKVSDACNSCGWCVNNCPAGNIAIINDRPTFMSQCHLCLRCIYGCPKKALKPGICKFVVIKEGFSINDLEKKLPYQGERNVAELAKGYLWSGVRKYLLEQDINKNR